MAQRMKLKVKIYTWKSYLKDKFNPIRYFKPALVTPPVIVADKFFKNVESETGLSVYQAKAVLSSIVRTAGDYLEAGNAVQLDEDFGTLKPFLKVKGTTVLSECNSSAILGIGIKFIPTGKMRELLGDVQFQFVGTTENSGEVEDSEVITPGEGDENGGDENGGSEEGQYTLTFKDASGNVVETQHYNEGDTVTAPTAPTGYVWTDCPTTMPARDLIVTAVEEGGDSGEI